jgi:hypothetical protein
MSRRAMFSSEPFDAFLVAVFAAGVVLILGWDVVFESRAKSLLRLRIE